MNKNIFKTPDGTRDLLFEECEVQNRIKAALSGVFSSRGYTQVVTPTMENYDLFRMDSAGLAENEMYKLVSNTGNMLVLRPDITMPIARLAATRLKDAPLPIRLHYTEKVFRVSPDYKGRSNEITQSGVELIGAQGLASDLEIIHMAAKCFEACNITDYKIEIGHAGVFKALATALGVSDEETEEIRLAIESKNYSTLEDILEDIGQNAAVKALKMLPRLFGGEDVLKTAKDLFGDIAADELDYLKTLYNALQPELGDKISLDLGLVNRNNYYTGVVFRAYTSGCGDTAISGGRYDTLLNEFGLNQPAIGFAVDNNVLTELELNNFSYGTTSPKRLIYPALGFEMKALKYMDEKIAKGEICEIMTSDGGNCIEDLKLRNANFADLVSETITTKE